MRALLSAAILAAGACAHAQGFATRVVEYVPAPGQNVNTASPQGLTFNDPARALAAPLGGGTLVPSNAKVVTLGGFGGSITLGFAATVVNDVDNPMGLDAIVFGNAYWVDHNPRRRWAEAAVIEISRDANGNGQADDAWYVVRGSSLPPAPGAVRRTQPWDNNAATPTPPANLAWYPGPAGFPGWPAAYSTSACELPTEFRALPLVTPAATAPGQEAHWGYADMSPTLLLGDMSGAVGSATLDNRLDQPEDQPGIAPADFYTVPDDPRAAGVTPGSGGGDAFDIAWAVDPATGAPANLDGFDFIRISTGVDWIAGVFGEVSAEVGAVADVRPDLAGLLPGDANRDGLVNFLDLNAVLAAFGAAGLPGSIAADVNRDGFVNFLDLNAVLAGFGAGQGRGS